MNWERTLTNCIDANDSVGALRVLQRKVTDHAGTPPSIIKRRAVKLIGDHSTPTQLRSWIDALSKDSSPTAKELVCGLLKQDGLVPLPRMKELVICFADDDNWEVRESAAGLCGHLLRADFDTWYGVFTDYCSHDSANIRRAVALSVKYAAKGQNPDWARPLLDLVERLLKDRNEYVRKNLGPFAVGDGLLRYYPDRTLSRIKRWVRNRNEVVCWNAAMSLSTAEARKHLSKILPILAELANDDRRFVWRAVVAALKNHARKEPIAVKPTLDKLHGATTTRHVAEAVRKFVS